MSDDTAIIFVMPFDKCSVPGTRPVNCSRCGAECGISPQTDKATAEYPRREFVCDTCISHDELQHRLLAMRFTPGQIQEVVDALLSSSKESMSDEDATKLVEKQFSKMKAAGVPLLDRDDWINTMKQEIRAMESKGRPRQIIELTFARATDILIELASHAN